MRFLFLNQYGPPDRAPTAQLLGEVADGLRAHGHIVDFVSDAADYLASQGTGRRLVREFMALLRLAWKGLRRERPAVVLSGSSPPCLAVVAGVIAWWHGARSVHWAMDLYPELAVALGEFREGWLSRVLGEFQRAAYRGCERVVVLDEDMATTLRGYGVESEIVQPWVLEGRTIPSGQASPRTLHAGLPWRWIYSGNLGRAHEWRTLLEAQAIVERRGMEAELVFQGGGGSWSAAREHAAGLGLKGCRFRPYVPERELVATLLESDCLVASQVASARGLLWPSKLALLLAMPRPMLWVGARNGACWRLVEGKERSACFEPGDAEALAEWICGRVSSGYALEVVTEFGGGDGDGLARLVSLLTGEGVGAEFHGGASACCS